MEHECEQQHFTPLVFTSHTGRVFQVDADHIPLLSPNHAKSNSMVSIAELRASSPTPSKAHELGFDGSGSETLQLPR